MIETIGEYIKMNGTIIGFNKLFLCACSVDETLAWHFYGVKPDKKKKNWSCSQILNIDYELFKCACVYTHVSMSLQTLIS